MVRAFHWTCSESSGAELIPLLVSTAEASAPQGEQLWGLHTGTFTGEDLGLPVLCCEGGKGTEHNLPSVWDSHEPCNTFLIAHSPHHGWMRRVKLHLPQVCYECAYGKGIC